MLIKKIKPAEKIPNKSKNLEMRQNTLQKAKEALEKNDVSKAKKLYIDARRVYMGIDFKNKKEIYDELMELYDRLK